MEEHECRAPLHRQQIMPWNNTPVLHWAAVKATQFVQTRTGSQGTVLTVRQPGEPHTNPWIGDIRARMARNVREVFGRTCMQIQGDLIILMV